MSETILEMKGVLDALKKIKVSGYVQSQFQVADSSGISSFSGGNFPQNSHSRFQVRRGRLKVAYDNDLTQYVLQIDVTQNGVGIKDAYVTILDPWEKAFGMPAGIFDRPFGFEIMYSSGSREMPERTRIVPDPLSRRARARRKAGNHEGVTLVGEQPERVASVLSELPEARKVELREGELTVFPAPGRRLLLEVITEAVRANGWAVSELRLEAGRLDEVFRQITREEVS